MTRPGSAFGGLGRARAVRSLRAGGVALALLVLAAGGWAIWDLRSKAMLDAKYSMRDQGILLAEQAARYVQLADVPLQRMQARVRALGVAGPGDLHRGLGDPATHALLAQLIANQPEGHAITLFDAHGDLVNTSRDLPAKPVNVADREYFRILQPESDGFVTFGALDANRFNGDKSVYIARRLSGRDGSFQGVVAATINTSNLLDFYRTISSDGRAGVTLLRRDGLVLARPGTLLVDRMPPESPWFTQVAAGGGTYVSPGYLSGVPVVVSANLLRTFPLVLDVAIPEADVLARWWRSAAYIAAASMALAAAVVALFWALGRKVAEQAAHGGVLAHAAAALQDSEAQLDRAQAIAGIGSWEWDLNDGQVFWSRHLFRILGLPGGERPDTDSILSRLVPEDVPPYREWREALNAGRQVGALDIRLRGESGGERVLRLEGHAVRGADGVVLRTFGTAQDVTERRRTERQLTQAQKLEAVGTLTGGMAHEFNNVLGVIIGNLDLLKPLVPPAGEAASLCHEAMDGAERCANLVRHLLAYARQQSLHPVRTDINALVQDVSRMISRTLGEHAQLHLDLDPALWPVVVDPVQLESALVNLATNARDAMPADGRLTIVTRNAVITPAAATDGAGLPAGRYAVIEIADTGSGIPPAILGQIFEPFFTTKAPGKGSGLGLSMVAGFVRQSGGQLRVDSQAGIGTTFRLYLPRAAAAAAAGAPQAASTGAHGDETILVVEDNAPLCRSITRQLTESGYRVRMADRADDALALFDAGQTFNLMLTDAVLAGDMDGIDLAQAAMQRQPGLRVLIMSGYLGGVQTERRMTALALKLLQKPFCRSQLSAAVRAELDMAGH